MKIPPQLVMLAVVGVGGSVLFAAESNRIAREPAMAMGPEAEVDKANKTQAPDASIGKPGDAVKNDKQDAEAKPQPDKTEPTKTEPATSTKDSATAAGASGDKPAEKSAADKSSASAKSSPQRFVPSEEVRADFDVSFPVDI